MIKLTKTQIFAGTAIGIVFLIGALAPWLNNAARIGAGYKAKILCSEIFVAGRDSNDVLANDFKDITLVLPLVRAGIDEENKSVRTSLFGLGKSQAIYRGMNGCTLLNGEDNFISTSSNPVAFTPSPLAAARPTSGEAIARIDYDAINTVLDDAIEDETAGHRAFVVLVDGRLVDECYASGFSEHSKFLSWSMAKSVLSTLVGASVSHNYLAVDFPAPVPEWSESPRAAITWHNLLQMQSGLEFEEDYAAINSDVNQMLWRSREMGARAAASNLRYEPGEFWDYSSGTSNILARALANTLEEQNLDLQSFAKSTLFGPIGAASFVLETDTAGQFIGSSFVYATARDWARLGQLYLQNGEWDGASIISPEWVDYVQQPAAASDNQYSAHFWLNSSGKDAREKFIPGLPENVYFMAGHEGQYVFIIPSKNAVIVRTGITRNAEPINVTGPVVTALFEAIGDAEK